MAGIYLHIPFCKQACHYCDFHFSVNTGIKSELVLAMADEIALQRDYLKGERVETIYFGGGTPSMLNDEELSLLLATVRENHSLSATPEVTLEANPDDLTGSRLAALHAMGINRLSIGIQSFDDAVLKYLNRAHNAETAIHSVEWARQAGFSNITIDLIYAIPGLSLDAWKANVAQALKLHPPHISAYTLTIEEKTVFGNWLTKGKLRPVDEGQAAEQLEYLMEALSQAGYHQYEISNFSLPGCESRHNSSYWSGIPYLGIGPSAHSYNKTTRQHNIANNHRYVEAIRSKVVPAEVEILTVSNRVNEYILTSLRTESGTNLSVLTRELGYDLLTQHSRYVSQLEAHSLIEIQDQHLRLTRAGRLLADKIAADLFLAED